ncbi:MAG: family 20 glycosylhydrolase [Candidatus Aminicenantales bacterium]
MKKISALLTVMSLVLFCLHSCAPKAKPLAVPRMQPFWLGLHVLIENKAAAEALITELPALAKAGINLLIFEVDYNYEFVSHPELRGDDPISRETVKQVVRFCRDHQIRLIPEFQSLGHQSWAEKTYPLLVKYPHLDESPGKYAGNKGQDPWGTDFYCRSWCPLHPDVNPIIFALYDELIEVFEADALHVGMDEVFIIADADCPRCAGRPTSELFAKAVNDYHQHLVKERGVEMLMWGDRLLDGAATGYGKWEASMNGTHPAIDLIPRDIIICDWHYERMKSYPSIPLFLNKGFRVLPTSFRDVKQTKKLIDFSLAFPSERMLGHLCTIWNAPEAGKTAQWPPLLAAAKKIRKFTS